ncbi:unnamed protein product, partial [Polarella glacialis]
MLHWKTVIRGWEIDGLRNPKSILPKSVFLGYRRNHIVYSLVWHLIVCSVVSLVWGDYQPMHLEPMTPTNTNNKKNNGNNNHNDNKQQKQRAAAMLATPTTQNITTTAAAATTTATTTTKELQVLRNVSSR